MTEKLNQESEFRGIRVIKSWHIILGFLGMIFIAGISFGVNQNRVANVESRQEKLEIRQEKLEQNQKAIDEIKINLKILMKFQGLEYQGIQ
ncbi:MAG: hypothetical protein WA138_16080 [Parvibaculum sp.]